MGKKFFKKKKFLHNEKIKWFPRKIICLSTCVLFMASAIKFYPNSSYTNPGVEITMNYVVAHAGGAIEVDGKELTYLNCVEGFYQYYLDGTRFFEFDFVFSSDGKLVGSHCFEYLDGYSFKNRISYDEFKNTKIAGKFEGITEESLLNLCRLFPECKFIIDTKEKDEFSVYKRIVNLAEQQNLDISKAILPFVCSKEMLINLEKIYDFQEFMFTNYKNYYSTNQLLNLIGEFDKIRYVHVFPIDFFRVDIEKINQQRVRVFAHMDKENFLKTALDYGCTGIFSDNITENEFKKNHYDFMIKKLGGAKQEEILPSKQTDKVKVQPVLEF